MKIIIIDEIRVELSKKEAGKTERRLQPSTWEKKEKLKRKISYMTGYAAT